MADKLKIALAAALVIAGIAAFYYYPALSLTYAVIWTAFWLFTGGAMAVSVAVAERRANVPWVWTMAFGVVSIVGGFLAFMYPGLTLASLISLIASFGIVSGAVMLISLAKLRGFERDVTSAAHLGGRHQSA